MAKKSFFKKTLVCCAIALMYATTAFADVEINETNFPDPYFRNWILFNYSGGDNILTDTEIAAITSMNIYRTSISDLRGIEFFTELTELNCSNNGLLTLDVSDLKNLQHLNCKNNKLNSLNVSGLTNLQSLNCYFNNLTSLDVSGLVNLNFFSCIMNQLTSLDVSNLPNLQNLDCGVNQLVSLKISNLPNLEGLNCQNNQLTSFDVSSLGNLNWAWLSCDNQRPTLTLTGANDNFSVEVALNNPNIERFVDGITYEDGKLISNSNQIETTDFEVDVKGGTNIWLKPIKMSGTFTLKYIETTNVPEIKSKNRQAVGYYSITGQRLPKEPVSGTFIILYNNGEAEKMIKKK